MSSIYGGFQLEGSSINKNIVHLITEKTNWWNADSVDTFHQDNIFFGKATLGSNTDDNKIIKDIESEVNIVADARLDNKKELSKLLNISDNIGDSQLILKAYLKYGFDCLKYLRGAFAFAIWDIRKQQIFVARDQIGVKPINYYFKENLFLFGTQKKSILHFPKIQFKLNWNNIVQRTEGRNFAPHDTEYLNINRLNPAHYIIVDKSGLHKKRYWELDLNKPVHYKNKTDYVDHFLELFKEAVSVRMDTDGKVATHVSGGLDSGAIAAISQKIAIQSNKPLYGLAYTRPDEFIKDKYERVEESDYVDDVVEHIGLKECFKVNSPIFRLRSDKLYDEQKICDGFQIGNKINNEYEILMKAKENGISTVLSGFPGDELISYHYNSYQYDYLMQGRYWAFLRDKNDYPLRRKFKFLYYRFLKNNSSFISSIIKKRINRIKTGDILSQYVKTDYLLNKDYSPRLYNALYKNVEFDFFERIYNSNQHHQKHLLNAWPVSYRMETEHLVGLNYKINYRYPLADLNLLEYTINLPIAQRWDGVTHRLFFKNVCKRLLPVSFVDKKQPKGTIKPMLKYYGVPNDDSLLPMWKNLKKLDLVNFLDRSRTEKLIINKNVSSTLFKYLLISALGEKFNLDI